MAKKIGGVMAVANKFIRHSKPIALVANTKYPKSRTSGDGSTSELGGDFEW